MTWDPDRSELLRDQGEDIWDRWRYPSARLPEAWRNALGRDPHLRDARVVVDMVLARSKRVTVMGGRVFGEQYQSRTLTPIEISAGRDGTKVQIWPALLSEPDLSDSISIDENGVSAGSRSLTVSIDGQLIDPKNLIRSGWPITGRAEVSLLMPGMDWYERFIWLRGLIVRSSHGGLKEFVTLEITDPIYTAPEIPEWIIDANRFPDASLPEESVGERIPILINGFSRVPLVKIESIAGGGTNDEFLVCAGQNVTVNAVYSNNAVISSSDYSVEQVNDDIGLPITVVRFSSGSGDWNSDTASLYADVTENNAYTNGVIQVAEQLLNNYGEGPRRKLNSRLFSEAEAKMGRYGASATARQSPLMLVNQPASTYDILEQTLFEEYPMIGLAWEDAGIGPIVSDRRAAPVLNLVPGVYPVLDRPAGSHYAWQSTSQLRNHFVLRYDYNAETNVYSRVEQRTSETSTLCRWSQALYGKMPGQSRESVLINDQTTANMVLDWLVAHTAVPACEVTVQCYPEAWFLLRRGDAVRYTDPKVGFDEETAIVVGRSWRSGSVEFQLLVYPDFLSRLGGGSNIASTR